MPPQVTDTIRMILFLYYTWLLISLQVITLKVTDNWCMDTINVNPTQTIKKSAIPENRNDVLFGGQNPFFELDNKLENSIILKIIDSVTNE